MNVDAIRSRIVATLSPDTNVRRQAELELKTVRFPTLSPAALPPAASSKPHRMP
jgi:hypothetical protein